MTPSNVPLISMLLFCYNQEDWVLEALNSCLNQDYKNLEIIVSDDCSSDSTYIKLKKRLTKYSGPHRVTLLRNDKNIGIGLHVQKLLSLASGELLVMCAGDDISLTDRVSKTYKHWKEAGRPHALASSIRVIDSNGSFIDHSRNERFNNVCTYVVSRPELIKQHFTPSSPIQYLGASLTYSNEVYSQFGGFYAGIDNEDIILLGRALLLGDVVAIEDIGVHHRVTRTNVSASLESETNIRKHRRLPISEIFKLLQSRQSKIKANNKSLLLRYKQQKADIRRVFLSSEEVKSCLDLLLKDLDREIKHLIDLARESETGLMFATFKFLTLAISFRCYISIVKSRPSIMLAIAFKFFK